MASHAIEAQPLEAVDLPGALNYGHDIDPKLSTGAAAANRYMLNTLEQAKGINALRKSADPTVTRPAFLMNIEKSVKAFGEKAIAGLEQTRRAVATSLKDAETKLRSTVGISPTANGREIRDRLQAMSPDQRQTALAAAYRANDKEVIGAVHGVPALMHGCDPALMNALHDEYQRTVAPAEYASVKAHQKYAGYLENVGKDLMAFEVRALRGTGGYEKQREETASILKSYGIGFEG
jgi:hypothetical protein